MDYLKHYDNIVNRARGRSKSPGLERHHIIPKSCGGSDLPENLVYLTTREHYVSHLLLVKIYKNDPIYQKKMIYALWWMAKTKNVTTSRKTSHLYAKIRQMVAETITNDKNRSEKIKKAVREGRGPDPKKLSKLAKERLANLSKEEHTERIKKSALSGDPKKRADSIRKGKGSQYMLKTTSDEIITFWSYDDVESITGYSYDQIKYRIKRHQGVLLNGNIIVCIKKYIGNDKNIGKKRKR